MEGFNKEYADDTLYLLTWFTKKRGKLVGEESLLSIDVMELRRIFSITDPFILPEGVTDDEAYEDGYDPYMVSFVYDVDEEKAKALQPYATHKIRLEKYDYQLGSTSRSYFKDQ